MLLLLLAVQVGAREPVEIYTGSWPPFVRGGNEALGSAAQVVRAVFHNMDREAVFQDFGFAYSYLAVKKGTVLAAFPYFRTGTRRDEVVFSTTLFSVRNRLYFNLQFNNFSQAKVDPAAHRVGRVSGYSYGDTLDAGLGPCPISDSERCPVFGSDAEAVAALLGDRIDLLPMTDTVAAALLASDFPDQAQLLRPVPDDAFDSVSSLHLIAPDSAEGRALIEAFDASHAELLGAGVIPANDVSPASDGTRTASVVRIVASEGFPIVVGVDDSDPGRFFAVPEGTRAIVLEWSDKIAAPAEDDRLYGVMVDLSKVVILDGPHVGRELRIRNMHLSIAE